MVKTLLFLLALAALPGSLSASGLENFMTRFPDITKLNYLIQIRILETIAQDEPQPIYAAYIRPLLTNERDWIREQAEKSIKAIGAGK